MELVQFLMCVANRHERAKDEHEEELSDYWVRKKLSKTGRLKLKLTYQDEAALLRGVIASVRGKPSCLKGLTPPALGALSYILDAKIGNDIFLEGHEIVKKLAYDPEKIIVYLKAFEELKDSGWIRLMARPNIGFTDQPPFSYLMASVELGNTFHQAMGVSDCDSRSFASHDAYLDAVFSYLHAMIHDDNNLYRVDDQHADLSMVQPEGWVRRIEQRLQNSNCELPAEETRKSYSLSIFQYLTLLGLLGLRDGCLSYEFSNPSEVALLFSRGRVCQKLMKEHLFGEKSKLKRYRLLDSSHGNFGESIQLTQLGIKALLGKEYGKCTAQELRGKIRKNTLFDFEEPKLEKEAVKLPEKVTEAIRSLIFAESPQGKQIRKSWHVSLPAAWGAPTGSTVLLYGPPGTGKTLTAQYLASELKLPLLKIDASKVLSCWVGESEQNVRRIFDDYANIQRDLGKAPVLLLNEADQLLGARDAGTNSVDRMNNNMQNLLLEGLERFSGILVATTNRSDLLDSAFSRRFTYKLELPAPDKNLRIELWKSHLPLQRLAEDVDIGQLADLALSGGEIRLVIERAVRLLAYRGITTINHKILHDIAKEEIASRMKRNGNANRIGF